MVCRVTIEEFVEAWALLGVEVSKEEAASFFHVYGMDKQGLMPYQVRSKVRRKKVTFELR